MSNEYPAGEVEVRGTKYPLTVDDHGYWSTSYNRELVAAQTRDQVREILMNKTKRAAAKVEVRFSTLARPRYGGELYNRLGSATGIHSSNGNVLVRWDDARGSEQITERYSSDYFIPPLAEDEATELIALKEAAQAAVNAVSVFETSHGATRLHTAVVEAIEAAVKSDDTGDGGD
jgi:hypothetical protein